jgi:hypothetical protein
VGHGSSATAGLGQMLGGTCVFAAVCRYHGRLRCPSAQWCKALWDSGHLQQDGSGSRQPSHSRPGADARGKLCVFSSLLLSRQAKLPFSPLVQGIVGQ